MYSNFLKRMLDFLISLFLIPFILPIALLLIILIRLESKGSPFFFQKRVGRNGQTFLLVKLRSMQVQNMNLSNTNSYRTRKNDSRITKIGNFIRKFSLDELPQIFNILIGDMSLVGPRPDVPQMETLYNIEEWQKRHSIRPGLTGLAQIKIRSSGTQEQRTKYDLFYVDNLSFPLDIKIIFYTIFKVLNRYGAN